LRADQAGVTLWVQPRAHIPKKKVRRKRLEQIKKHVPVQPPRGPLIIAVSIGDQRIRVYDAGVQIAEGAVSTGMRGYPTPTGVFSVIQKHKWHRSNIYSGAPMPYMQRITWSGVALHAGVLPGYPASHGCIRMSHDFAVRLWGMTKLGARVIVAHRGIAPQEISHASLLALKKKPVDPPPAEPPAPLPAGAESGRTVLDATAASADLTAGKTAAAEAPVTDASNAPAVDEPKAVEKPKSEEPDVANPGERPAGTDGVQPDVAVAPKPLRPGPVSVFISRKASKLFVRKGFEPVFDTTVTIARPELPLGTHLFTATAFADDGLGMRWIAVSMPGEPPKAEPPAKTGRGRSRAAAQKPVVSVRASRLLPTAAEALDRIELPKEAIERISELLSPGASLIVSDQGLGYETGKGTDFIVLTR
jgi:hypothetical protein